ncbi:MAG: hypothetical protein ACTSWN_02500 [Promethearchaeota archaeon]
MIQIPQKRKNVKEQRSVHAKKIKTCNIRGCNAPSVKTLSRQENEDYLKKAGLALENNKERKIRACDKHYKMIKKFKKKDDKIKKVRYEAARARQLGKFRR